LPERSILMNRPDLGMDLFAKNPEVGAATGIEFLDSGLLQAVAEPQRAAAWYPGLILPGQLAQTPTRSHGPQIAKVMPLDAWMLT
jgi:hypothetical protein